MSEAVQPLSGIRVLDLGVGMCSALAAKVLVDAGAEVLRFEPPEGDPFYDVYPAYRVWQHGKTIRAGAAADIIAALPGADLCIVGGEEFPGLRWRHDAHALRERAEQLIVLDIAAHPWSWPGERFPAVELFAQAQSGLVFEHYSDRPIMFAFPAASYGAALHGVAGLLAALFARTTTGRGDVVYTSLLQGALRWCASIWADVERPEPAFAALIPKDVVPFRFQCADDVHVHITPGVPGTYAKVYDVLGIVDPTLDRQSRGSPTGGVDPRRYFGDVDLMASRAREWQSADLLKALWALEVPVETVLLPGECWDDAQAIHNKVTVRDESGWEYVGNPIKFGTTSRLQPFTEAQASAGTGPLSGTRIVDMGCFAAGPHASVILGDLGADVIKVERLDGDPMRAGFHNFAASSRGKRSIAVDAKHPKGAEVIRRLCAAADIVHHNFRPGVSARLGVDARTLQEVNPAVIVLETYAYGPDGPKSQQSGFDSSLQALCGHESFPGGKHNPPINYRIPIADYGTATVGALAMLLALLQRQRGSVSSDVWTSLLSGGAFLRAEVVRTPDGRFAGVLSFDAEHRGHHPAESLYRTADGWIAVAARDEAMSKRLASSLGLTVALRAPRSEWGESEADVLVCAIAKQSTADILRTLHAADVWAVPCDRTLDSVLSEDSLRASGLVIEVDNEPLGRTRQIVHAINYERTPLPMQSRGHIDVIGGHTRQILEEYGYKPEEVADLFARKIVA